MSGSYGTAQVSSSSGRLLDVELAPTLAQAVEDLVLARARPSSLIRYELVWIEVVDPDTEKFANA